MNKDLVWYPADILPQPLGEGTQKYDFDNAVQMLHDMEPYSHFEELFDPLELLSGHPNEGKVVKSQVINMIVSQSL